MRHDLQVSQIIAPAVLAVYTLNLSRISVMDTATLLFGYFLAEKLEPPSLFWGFIATLVAAVYYGYGALLAAAAMHDLPCVAFARPQTLPFRTCQPHRETDMHTGQSHHADTKTFHGDGQVHAPRVMLYEPSRAGESSL